MSADFSPRAVRGCVDRVQSTDGGGQQTHRHAKKYAWLGLGLWDLVVATATQEIQP